MSLETDPFLDAVAAVLAAGVAELEARNVIVWHHGESDPDEDIRAAAGRSQGVSVLIYDEGGEGGDDDDTLAATASVELYVLPAKSRRAGHENGKRLAGEIRNDMMRALHRAPALRNTAPFFDCRVRGYTPIADDEYTAWRITISHSIYLDP